MAKRAGGNTISATGGVKIPPVDSFIAGYKAGAAKCAPGTKVLVGYSQDFIAQDKCKAVAQNQIAAGAKVVFAVAGPCGFGALAAAKEAGVWGDGVDVDQSYLGPHILTSAVKRVDLGVFRFVQAVQAGTLVPGHDFVFDLKNGGVARRQDQPEGPRGLQGEARAAAELRSRPARSRCRTSSRSGIARRHTRRGGPRARLFLFRERIPPHVRHPPVLELRGITKQFPGVLANDHVDFELLEGEVHALLGENGAGKSTLMNILYGLYHPDEGDILLKGKKVSFSSAKDAIEAGIGMVHQHFMLIPVMTVAENIVLAEEPTYAGVMLDFREAKKKVRELSERFGLAVDPDARIQDITVAQQQRVEILKALFRGAEILVLDEPTAVLTPQEAKELFAILDELRAQGKSIIFISHKLHEVLEVADRITVLRRGKMIETVPKEGATEESLARAMVGREVLLRVEKPPSTPGESLLRVDGLHVFDDRGLEKVRGVSFDVRAGEIVGIAGVDGNGQTELIDALTGLTPFAEGKISVADKEVDRASTSREMLDHGIGHIPEDRQRRGLVLEFSIAENIALHDYNMEPDSKLGWLYPSRLVERAGRLIKDFDVRGGGPQTRAGALSGGNQQKVVVAREVARNPKVLIAAQPTRGLDVGAIEYVHRRLVAERGAGRAVLLVSLELDEVMSLSDRILVIFEGEIVGEYDPGVTEEELGIAMTGGRRKETAAA